MTQKPSPELSPRPARVPARHLSDLDEPEALPLSQDVQLPLPHERDEAPDHDGSGEEAPQGPRQVIEQAARDVKRGLRDTDMHGIPSNVPGPGVSPEESPGAEVPEDGVDVGAYAGRKERPAPEEGK